MGEEMQKVTVNFSDEYKMKDWLKFGVQMNGAYMLPDDAQNVTGAIHAAPISPIYDDATGGYYKLPSFQSSQISNPMIDVYKSQVVFGCPSISESSLRRQAGQRGVPVWMRRQCGQRYQRSEWQTFPPSMRSGRPSTSAAASVRRARS